MSWELLRVVDSLGFEGKGSLASIERSRCCPGSRHPNPARSLWRSREQSLLPLPQSSFQETKDLHQGHGLALSLSPHTGSRSVSQDSREFPAGHFYSLWYRCPSLEGPGGKGSAR